MRTLIASMFLVALGCHSPPATSADAPEPAPREPIAPAQAVERGAEAPPKCRPLIEAEVAAEAFVRGQAKIEDSREGEHVRSDLFRDGLATLKLAANNGSLKAQSLYGRSLFGARFTKGAPTPEEKEDYVSALSFLRIAAKAGDEDAVGYVPGLLFDPGEPPEAPLDSLPAGWVAEAFEVADAWIECYGLPAAG